MECIEQNHNILQTFLTKHYIDIIYKMYVYINYNNMLGIKFYEYLLYLMNTQIVNPFYVYLLNTH